ncbi:MAG: AAA family ATPase, partial [bacterium]|nr:AAA family ATPase [bacterium]
KVLSKYYGETSKLIGTLYETAVSKAAKTPSIVFIDEFDALSPSRSGDVSEASRRALGTLLTQLDGFRDKKTDRLVLTLAATNTPWDLDDACLSRFPRRIYVQLPDAKAAEAIIKVQTKGLDLSGIKLSPISVECSRKLYSGRDITYMCQQASWNMIREENKNLHQMSSLPYEELRQKSLKTRPLKESDFQFALESIKSPVMKEILEKHQKWAEEFGG